MADVPPAGIDLKADQGPRLVGSMIVLVVLPTIFVIARLISRRIARAGYWYDDLLVTIACALCYVLFVCILISKRNNGFGRHIYILKDPENKTLVFIKILYVYELVHFASITTIKLAILAFYRRIFPVKEIKLLLLLATGVVLTWFLGSSLAIIFQCTPIDKFWNVHKAGHCVNPDIVQLIPGAINCVLNFLIVALPIPLLWRLRTTISQKGVLTGIFTCAGFVCIISIIRLIVLSRLASYDVTWDYVDSAIWSAAEPCMGVISACLPSLRPLFSILASGNTRALSGKRAAKSSAQDTSSAPSRFAWRSRTEDDDDGHFQRLHDPAEHKQRWGHDVSVQGGKYEAGRGTDDQISLEEMNVPATGIRVKEEVVVTSSDWLEYKDRLF